MVYLALFSDTVLKRMVEQTPTESMCPCQVGLGHTLHVMIVQADAFRAIILGNFKLIHIHTVEFDVASSGNVSERQHVHNFLRAVQNVTISWYRASQVCYCLLGLCINGQATFHFLMNIC